ncbi:hypothetical protein IRJ41_000975 [Triplophysa rosa]|uniref:Uncharacterized protein n=1 Tax=Triplophysa rosa TaxID=992332 RepID=A0A9W7T5T3_TRIRA|nr:hypothetical protein IRJ41_000975 [Triplophysa rosa]
MDLVALKVVLEHRSEKLTLPAGIPSTIEQLSKIVKETFGLVEDFTLHYLDEDFGDYFTLHSTDHIKHKGTIKVVTIPSVVLTFTALTENDPSSSTDTRPDIQTDPSSATDTRPDIQTDGIAKDQQEVDRNQLIEESKKRDSTAIKDLMCRTFAHRRHDVISLQMSIKDIKDRWPTLCNVSQISAEFQRITTMNLEPKFMSMLDLYSPKLLSLFQVKKGALGERLRAQLSILHQSGISMHRKREVVIRCLVGYLGEDACGLIKEFEDSADHPVIVEEELAEEAIKTYILQSNGAVTDDSADHPVIVEEELAEEAIKTYILQSNGAVTDVEVVIEGITVLKNLDHLSRACCYLLGLTYSLDLRYPKTHGYIFEVFQKLNSLLKFRDKKISCLHRLARSSHRMGIPVGIFFILIVFKG